MAVAEAEPRMHGATLPPACLHARWGPGGGGSGLGAVPSGKDHKEFEQRQPRKHPSNKFWAVFAAKLCLNGIW